MDVIVYTDFKSPYAYLAKDLIYALEDELGFQADWRHYTLDIPSYLGSAELNAAGEVVSGTRSDHQWRRVKYAYMDVRRYASLRGLTVRGTTKIWDSSLAGIALYWAKGQGQPVMRAFMDAVFEPFWKRELDIEDIDVLLTKLGEAGASTAGFEDYARTDGRQLHDRLRAEAEANGVFGVPTLFLDNEMFFGREQLPLIRWKLTGERGDAPV